MAHAYFHAKSSARLFGGTLEDYLAIHELMDHTKMHLADCRHRLFLHNTWGIFLVEKISGKTLLRSSDGKVVPLRPVLEQHVIEDFGHIPTLQESVEGIAIEQWMYGQARPLSRLNDLQKI